MLDISDRPYQLHCEQTGEVRNLIKVVPHYLAYEKLREIIEEKISWVSMGTS